MSQPGGLSVIYPGNNEVKYLDETRCGCLPLRKLCKDHVGRFLADELVQNEWLSTALENEWIDDVQPISRQRPHAQTRSFLRVQITALCLMELSCGCVYYMEPCWGHEQARKQGAIW